MNKDLSYEERKDWARLLYTRHDKTSKDVALTVGTDEATVRQWNQEDAWDGVKRSLLTSKAMQLEQFYSQLEKLNAKLKDEQDANPKTMDLVVKYTNAIKNLEVEVSISEIIEVSELFVLWLQRKDIKLTRKLIVQFNEFIKQRIAA